MVSSLGGFKYVHADMKSCAYEPLPRYYLTVQLQISLWAFLSQASLRKAQSPFPILRPAAKGERHQVRPKVKHYPKASPGDIPVCK